MFKSTRLHRNRIEAGAADVNDILDLSNYPIRIQYAPNKGVHVIATRDIRKGDCVLLECPLGISLLSEYSRMYCAGCCGKISPIEAKAWLSRADNDKECVLCEECSANNQLVDAINILKKLGVSLKANKGEDIGLYRLFYNALFGYSEARSLSLDDEKVVMCNSDALYMLVWDSLGISAELNNDIENIAANIALILMQVSIPVTPTRTEIAQMCKTIICNQHAVSTSDGEEIGRSICPVAACFNHSCAPNVSWSIGTGTNGLITLKATDNITAGTELCISYLNPRALSKLSDKARLEKLYTTLHFACQQRTHAGAANQCAIAQESVNSATGQRTRTTVHNGLLESTL